MLPKLGLLGALIPCSFARAQLFRRVQTALVALHCRVDGAPKVVRSLHRQDLGWVCIRIDTQKQTSRQPGEIGREKWKNVAFRQPANKTKYFRKGHTHTVDGQNSLRTSWVWCFINHHLYGCVYCKWCRISSIHSRSGHVEKLIIPFLFLFGHNESLSRLGFRRPRMLVSFWIPLNQPTNHNLSDNSG